MYCFPVPSCLSPLEAFPHPKSHREIIHSLRHGFLKALGLKCERLCFLLWRDIILETSDFPLWVISPGSIRTWDFGPASTWLHLTSSSFSYCYPPLPTASPLARVASLGYNHLGFFCQGTGPELDKRRVSYMHWNVSREHC